MPHRNSTKTSATFSKEPPLLSTSPFWVWAAPSTTPTMKPFKELGLDSQRIKKLAYKLHVHSVNFAAKLVHTRRALSSTVINSHQEPVSGQALQPSWSPLIFPFLFALEEIYGTRYQSGSFSLINVGSGFHCLRSFSLSHDLSLPTNGRDSTGLILKSNLFRTLQATNKWMQRHTTSSHLGKKGKKALFWIRWSVGWETETWKTFTGKMTTHAVENNFNFL